jgi:hypothetical protein
MADTPRSVWFAATLNALENFVESLISLVRDPDIQQQRSPRSSFQRKLEPRLFVDAKHLEY